MLSLRIFPSLSNLLSRHFVHVICVFGYRVCSKGRLDPTKKNAVLREFQMSRLHPYITRYMHVWLKLVRQEHSRGANRRAEPLGKESVTFPTHTFTNHRKVGFLFRSH